jgi:nitroreductase
MMEGEIAGMEVYECIRTRRTIREFKPDPVPEEVVYKILQAARWAPSSGNSQPWHFIVITDRDTLESIGRIATSGAFVGQAPLAIAIVMDNARRPDLDAGRALQQMELMA